MRPWLKVVCIVFLIYTVIAGFLMPVPKLNILNETIRNLYFHVPMWFTMMVLFGYGFYYSIMYLRKGDLKLDIKAMSYTNTGIVFSILGLISGMIWANYTWGQPWGNDPKQFGTALCMLIYFAYMILRGGIKDEEKRAQIAAVFNIFAFAMLIPLLFILPRMTDSLHPGNGGNPAFSQYDLDNNMRLVFWPASIGWILLGIWFAGLRASVELKIAAKLDLISLNDTTLHNQK